MTKRYTGGVVSSSLPTVNAAGASGVFLLSQQADAQAKNNWPPFKVEKSLRFRSSASAYLNRTPASAGNRQIFTWSGWVKRGELGNEDMLFSSYPTNGDNNQLRFSNDNKIGIYLEDGVTGLLVTTSVYRDPAAWYHIVFAVDTTQATSSNRIKLYVNGSQVTAFDTSTYPSQNYNTGFNNTILHTIGESARLSGRNFDGYMTEINMIDGQALTPSSFGGTDKDGNWSPIAYTGTYGQNGFYLNFKDATSTTTLGYDYSGNGNHWTSNNLSVTAGATYDSMIDVPEDQASANVRGNYCVANPLEKGSAFTVSNGNLTIDINASKPVFASVKGTFGITSGKWYWECVKTSSGSGLSQSGVWASDNLSLNINSDLNLNGNLASLNNIGMFGSTAAGDLVKTGLNSQDYATLGSYTNGDVIGIAFDADSGKLYAYKNGTEFTGQAIGSGTSILPTMATGKTYQPFVYSGNGGSGTENATTNINFGQRPFTYTPPSGFKSLNTFNLPDPAIKQPNKNFDINLYTGTGSSKTVTNAGQFAPDFVWIKSRNDTSWHQLFDTIRGALKGLYTNSTYQETTQTDSFNAFTSTGFTLGADATSGSVNTNNHTYVAWQWNAGGANTTNTSGTITSLVRANPTAGFSIVTYTGTGANATVGHGLGVAPSMVIVKTRSASGQNWQVYHSALGQNKILQLDLTTSVDTITNYWYNGTTSTVFGINGSYAGINGNGNTYVAYCWSEIAGYSKFGSYTGNGSTDGPFVYTGFRPRFVMVKTSSNAGYNWNTHDAARNPSNSSNLVLYPNTSAGDDAYGAGSGLDILSNGFKPRDAGGGLNGSGFTYIYMAFAEAPFKYARSR